MASIDKRLADLERAHKPGRIVVCDGRGIDGAELERKHAAAEAEAGPNGTVILLRYGAPHNERGD